MKIISGQYKGKTLHTSKGKKVRPTSARLRETAFNILQNNIKEASFLDLFAGSGAMGLEAISRGAAHATLVEESRDSIRLIQKNIDTVGVNVQTTLMHSDVLDALKAFQARHKTFDVIYMDPPYSLGNEEMPVSLEALLLIDAFGLLSPEGRLLIEESKNADLEKKPLKTLVLKDKRTCGRSVLYQFINQ